MTMAISQATKDVLQKYLSDVIMPVWTGEQMETELVWSGIGYVMIAYELPSGEVSVEFTTRSAHSADIYRTMFWPRKGQF